MKGIVELTEYSQHKIPLKDLGYLNLAKRVLYQKGQIELLNYAINQFMKKNKERLDFLGVKVEGDKFISSGRSGIVPLLPFDSSDKPVILSVKPMFSWSLLSEFVGRTSHSNWLEVRADWLLDRRDIDLKIWYFAHPFLKEARKVMERPGYAFSSIKQIESVPLGNTDWQDYAITKFPYGKVEFNNEKYLKSLNALPHSLMKWCVEEVEKSIDRPHVVPIDFRNDLYWLRDILRNVPIEIPNRKNLNSLLRSGAWTGYLKVYEEILRIATLTGVVKESPQKGCAFSIKTEFLFELIVNKFCKEWALRNGMQFEQDLDDSSRIGLNSITNYETIFLRSLRPDIAMVSENTVIIVDAKYKKHYDYANGRRKIPQNSDWKNDYRNNIHQVVSYGSGFRKNNYLFLLSHPTVGKTTNEELDHGLQLWEIGVNQKWVGLLPVSFISNFKKVSEIKELFFQGLDEALKVINKNPK
ncbi:5-methylcytosine restriction system specificity protein McrC [Priestia aryabhattai]|uniref:5-methylcytosine restriction system specificity protein McrC n=1 Tax=Priestia aryabhattai TaxID=412384 RepID=UPI00203AF715|nr:hypothetical protein [Priestia aryabhattai]MCM3255577.1 hypothetical protein [Priestia aryabhattai]